LYVDILEKGTSKAYFIDIYKYIFIGGEAKYQQCKGKDVACNLIGEVVKGWRS